MVSQWYPEGIFPENIFGVPAQMDAWTLPEANPGGPSCTRQLDTIIRI